MGCGQFCVEGTWLAASCYLNLEGTQLAASSVLRLLGYSYLWVKGTWLAVSGHIWVEGTFASGQLYDEGACLALALGSWVTVPDSNYRGC